MSTIKVSYHYITPSGSLAFIIDTISDNIMNKSGVNMLNLKGFYCLERGLKKENVQGWEVKMEDGED